MSVEGHKQQAGSTAVTATIVVVSSTRTAATDTSGKRIAEQLKEAGHTVTGPSVVDDDVVAIRSAVAAATTDVVVLTGGTGLSARDVTPEALRGLVTRQLPGFGELFRMLSFEQIGAAAMLSRASAGLCGNKVVFALPGSEAGVALAMDRLILPELAHLVHQIGKEAPAAAEPEAAEPEVVDAEFEEVEDEGPKLPPPSGKLGQLGNQGMSLSMAEHVATKQRAASSSGTMSGESEPETPSRGWKRAIYEIKGELIRDKREELPENIENLAPVVDVLHTAGESAVLKLDSGRRYSIWGFPDLQRPGSKVLAIGWGEPLAEVLALHRYPVTTGTCIEEGWGLAPRASDNVSAVCEAVCGRAPKDTSGQLFAVQGDTVWILRGSRVVRWDGSKEHDDGNPKQVLASLALHWSNR